MTFRGGLRLDKINKIKGPKSNRKKKIKVKVQICQVIVTQGVRAWGLVVLEMVPSIDTLLNTGNPTFSYFRDSEAQAPL